MEDAKLAKPSQICSLSDQFLNLHIKSVCTAVFTFMEVNITMAKHLVLFIQDLKNFCEVASQT